MTELSQMPFHKELLSAKFRPCYPGTNELIIPKIPTYGDKICSIITAFN